MNDPALPDVTEDALLGGRLMLRQPRKGHRAGLDAMLLIAAAGEGQSVADLGAGPGAIGLGLLALGRFERAALLERDPVMAGLARQSAALNGLVDRATVVEGDLTTPAATDMALVAGRFDIVLSNPPYNDPNRHRASPLVQRAAAHEMPEGGFVAWLKAALRLASADARLVILHRPEALPSILPEIAARCGDIAILPVHAAPDAPAIRVLIGARPNSKAPARLRPALHLHDREGQASPMADAIGRGEARLALW